MEQIARDLAVDSLHSEKDSHDPPVVIVGTGPVGMRTAQELLTRNPTMPIVLYGNEPWLPYNRVRLSSLLSGQLTWFSTFAPLTLPEGARVEQRFNCAVVGIDREAQTVTDASGLHQPYSKLILATGSTPHIPNIENLSLSGVYTFRSMSDAEKLLARRVRTRRTVVLGGGLLGLEAARAMHRFNTDIIVVEHGTRLMNRQLDDGGAELLREAVLKQGIHVVLRDSVVRVRGDHAVSGVELRSGRIISCDTIIVATGIIPNVELAWRAKLAVGRGIRVDDCMRTSDPNIYSVGECAEHRGQVYGLVGPGFEQAGVAAHHITGAGNTRYKGSVAAAKLKVVEQRVFSMGPVGDEENPHNYRYVVFENRGMQIYRKLIFRRQRLVGAIAFGDWDQLGRLQEAITRRRIMLPWEIARFRRNGNLWADRADDSVATWPAGAVVCNCAGVSRGDLTQAITEGCGSVACLMERTGASTVCGSCRPLISELVGVAAAQDTGGSRRGMLMTATFALLVAALVLASPPLPHSGSVQTPIRLDTLWIDGFWKQVSGYFLLALSALGLLVSLRKRWKRFKFGDYTSWQYAHVVIGLLLVGVLVLHTGLRLGENLNQWLIVDFLLLSLLGAATGLVVAVERKMAPRTAKRLRSVWTWAHTFAFWPLPVLLGFHVLSVYYF